MGSPAYTLSDLTLCFPLVRARPIEFCLERIDAPVNILLLCDGAQHEAVQSCRALAEENERIRILEVPFKNSLARSWNLLIALSSTPWVMINNDDIAINQDSWEQIVVDMNGAFDLVSYWEWASFMLHKRLIPKVGWFDERFNGGNMEDTDYQYRLIHAGVQRFVHERDRHVVHLRDNPAYRELFLTERPVGYYGSWTDTYQENMKFFLQKWPGWPPPHYKNSPYEVASYLPLLPEVDWHPQYTKMFRESYGP